MSRKYANLSDEVGTSIIGVVRPDGNSAKVLAPKKWMGKMVRVTIIDEEEAE